MKIEHFALNVENPVEMAKWYVEHLGLTIVRQNFTAPFMTFLADDSGRVMIEIYTNPADQVPPYRTMNPLLVHLAFVSADPIKDRERLVKAGATAVSEQNLEDGTQLVMMRDPWGLSVQLCKRGKAMLLDKEKIN